MDQRLLFARDGNVDVADVQDAVFEPGCFHRIPLRKRMCESGIMP